MNSQDAKRRRTEEVASRLRHDLVQPPAALKLLVSNFRDELSCDDRRELIDVIDCALDDLRDSLERLVEFQTLTIAPPTPSIDVVSLGDAVAAAVSGLGTPAETLIETSVNTRVLADQRLLALCLKSGLDNAIDFGRERTMRITSAQSDETISLHIDDQGIGLALDDRQAYLEPFFVDQAHLTRRPARLGLGLASAQAAAGLMDACVSLAASPLGGARYTITLPAVDTD